MLVIPWKYRALEAYWIFQALLDCHFNLRSSPESLVDNANYAPMHGFRQQKAVVARGACQDKTKNVIWDVQVQGVWAGEDHWIIG